MPADCNTPAGTLALCCRAVWEEWLAAGEPSPQALADLREALELIPEPIEESEPLESTSTAKN